MRGEPYIIDEEGIVPITPEQARAFESMRPRVSVVCPIRNEEKMLPRTIFSLYELCPDEVLFGLDRCTDGSERIIRDVSGQYPETKTRIRRFTENEGGDWKYRPAYLRRELYRDAQNTIILNTSADIRLDPLIRDHVERNPEYKLLSYGYLDYPFNPQSFIKTAISAITPIHGYAGLLSFNRDAWLETEDLEELKKIPRGEDTHLQLAIAKRHPTRHINTRSLHLRPNETRLDHYNRGLAAYHQLHIGAPRAFVSSFVMLRPALFTGYMHARNGHDKRR